MTSYKIERKIIAGLPKKKLNAKNFVVSHETANDNSKIDNEVSYMSRNWQNAFVTHFVGGGGRVIQVAETGFVSWGAGSKANGYAFAQIELCRTKDKATFLKDYVVYCQLLVDLAKKADIPVTLDSGSKSKDLSSAAKGGTVSKPAKPAVKPSSPAKNLGLVDYMVSKKMDSSFSNRAKLAAKYGIKGYKGTASQNITLLAKLKAGKPHKPASNNTYYTENPKKIKTLVQCDLYDSVDFTEKNKTGGTYPPGTIFTIAGMAKTKGGTPRLKTKSGYFLTANKKFVKKI
nr:DUF5776 domain-containing protein [Listeria monocytogenes]